MSDTVFRNPGEEVPVILPATHCLIWQCKEQIYDLGYCLEHYREWSGPRRQAVAKLPCSRPGCDKPCHARNICKDHYNEVYNEARRQRREAEKRAA